jgi:ribosomal subunit interface protein
MIQVKIDYKNMSQSDALNEVINENIEKLEKIFDRITTCHVVVSLPHRSHVHGKVFHVHIDLHIPGNNIVITREPEKDDSHDDVYFAVREAFKVAKRKLQTHVDKMRDDVKKHL